MLTGGIEEWSLAEQELPIEERIFTQFKIHQNQGQLDPRFLDKFFEEPGNVTKDEVFSLLGADLDHVRKIINTYILKGMRLLWFFIFILSIGGFF